jgi:hypothetical protein
VSDSSQSETIELEISVSDLRIGMHVVRLDKPWEESDFLIQGFFIHSLDDIDAVCRQCETVVIEGRTERRGEHAGTPPRKAEPGSLGRLFSRKGRGAAMPGQKSGNRRRDRNSASGGSTRINYINKVEISGEIARARSAYGEARSLAKSVMDGIRVGRAIDINQAKKVVNDCVDSILRNEDALTLLAKLKDKDEYTAEHSLNVSILSAAFGKHLGMLEGEIRMLGLCGLLHDVGKARVPDEILKKPGSLSPQEYVIMKNHATWRSA